MCAFSNFLGFFQGGMSQVRFQPRTGQYLAAATENVVGIYDVETETCVHSLQVSLRNSMTYKRIS